MALHFQIQKTPGGVFTDLDITAAQIATCKTHWSYTHPTMLQMEICAPQQSFPLGIRNFIRMWDDAATDFPQSASFPHFEGFIEEVSPGQDTNSVSIVAYDPTRKATSELTIMSLAWQNSTTPATGAVPRIVFNAAIDNDDDFAYSRIQWANIGNIIGTILDDQTPPLASFNAAPNNGVPAYYNPDLVGLSYIPQEKVVFESESLRSAIDRVLRYAPAWRMLWYPGTRQWRFGDISLSPQVTITLNRFLDTSNAQSAYCNVLSYQLHRSLEGRATALSVYGPPVLQQQQLYVSSGGLLDISDNTLLQNNLVSCCNVPGKNRWQIVNPQWRPIARRLPAGYDVQYDDYYFATTFSPALLGYWPQSSAGNAGWRVINDWHIKDARLGIIEINRNNFVYRYNPNPASGNPNYENPTDIQLVYCTFGAPLTVRVPASGFQGTAYTVANLTNEIRFYDEMLAVGYEYGTPITTAARVAQFTQLLTDELKQRQDIVYAGGCVLEGLQYAYQRLNARVNFAGVNGDGTVITTGWENINAFLTDVEYDFNEQTTTLSFSSDQLELMGINVDQLKAALRIKALERRDYTDVSFQTTIRQRTISDPVSGFDQQSTVHDTQINTQHTTEWVDPDTGKTQDGRNPNAGHQDQGGGAGLNSGPDATQNHVV